MKHLLLLGPASEKEGRWGAHPSLALRIERIYGRPMPPLPLLRPPAPAYTWA